MYNIVSTKVMAGVYRSFETISMIKITRNWFWPGVWLSISIIPIHAIEGIIIIMSSFEIINFFPTFTFRFQMPIWSYGIRTKCYKNLFFVGETRVKSQLSRKINFRWYFLAISHFERLVRKCKSLEKKYRTRSCFASQAVKSPLYHPPSYECRNHPLPYQKTSFSLSYPL